MLQSVQGLIYDSSQLTDAVLDDTNIYYVTQQAAYKRFDQATLTNTMTVFASSFTATGIALINTSSAVITYNSANFYFLELATGRTLNVTTNAAATQRNSAMQQVATNQSTQMGIATKSTTGSVTLINGSTFALSSLTVSAISGQNATCVIPKTGTSNFFIGTNDGKIHEIDTSGTAAKSLTLPITNRVGGALTSFQVGSLAYYNNLLLCADTGGILRLYDWSQSTPTLLDQYFATPWNLNQTIMLSNAASGTCYMTAPQSNNLYNHAIHEVYFEKGEILIESVWTGMSNSTTVIGTAINGNTGKLVQLSTGTTLPAAMRVLNISSLAKTTVLTEIQEPAGLQVPGRIIRLRDAGIGRSIVELDTTISAGATSLPCTQDRNYIELSLLTSPAKFDIREMKS